MKKVLPNHQERVNLIGRVIGIAEGATDTTHNRRVAWEHPTGLIHTFVGGSDLHGASVGSDDLDIFGVFIEKPSYALGIMGGHGEPDWATFQWSTSGNDRKNTRDDVDVVCHSLRKWANLASQGNPTIMHFLYTPPTGVASVWDDIVAARDLFVAKKHVNAFLGYAKQQWERLNGLRAANVTRPELVEAYGFDTKFAMHMIRLLFECREFLSSGWITLPNPKKDLLIDIRKGKYNLEFVNEMYANLESDCKQMTAASDLPEEVDRSKISQVVSEAYHTHWKLNDWHPSPHILARG